MGELFHMTRYLALALPCLVVLLMLPGVSFFFDITPKIVLLLLVASVFVLEIEWDLPAVLVSAYVLLGAVAAWASPFPQLALEGSAWRRTGVITEAALAATIFTGFL